MKVKELIQRLQSLDPDLNVYITNQEETQLTQIDVVIPCEDFGENDREEFVAIFPKHVSKSSNFENLEHRNLSQETANCDKFTLTAEEVEAVRFALAKRQYHLTNVMTAYEVDSVRLCTSNPEYLFIKEQLEREDPILTRIIQWQNERD